MNKIKLFITQYKIPIIITAIVTVIIVLTVILYKPPPPVTDQERINVAVDSAVAPLKRQIELNNHTNDSLLKVSKARDARDRMRDIKINQQYSEIDEINKKLREDNNNVRYYDAHDIDSFITKRYPR